MRQIPIALAIITFLGFTFACQQSEQVASEPKIDVQVDIQAIKDIVADFNTALNTGDIEKASFHMADKFRVIPPNRPLLNGKDASVRDLKQLFDQFTFREIDVVKDVQVNGDLAVTHYSWTCETTPKAEGESTNDNGNGIIALRKQPGGIWKFIYLIYSNESLVSPEQPAVSSSHVTSGAAEPIIGTWKLNFAKSKLNMSTDEQAKEEINAYSVTDDDMIELSTTTLLKDGSSESSKWIWPKEGGIAKCLSREIPEGMLYVETVVEPGQWYVTIMQDGKKIAMYHKMVSKDGKTLTQTLKGIGQDGNPVDILMVWDKQ